MSDTDPKTQVEQARKLGPKGEILGHHVITANGDLVLVRPGTIGLGADVERGAFVVGLKDGQRLATPSDVERKLVEERDRQAKEATPATPAA